jgi:CheY-like chemotaxis protein
MPTALIVEDEPEANKLLAMLIQLRGYQTLSAFTGREAIQTAQANRPDVVFLDLMLPDINGYEVCKTLKSRKPTCLIPVVIVTARIAEANRTESYVVGADDYVAKPYTPEQIFDSLEQADSWKRLLASPRIEGSISLDGQQGDEVLRRLSQMRSLLLARTNLGAEVASQIETLVRAIWASNDAWRAHHPEADAVTLAYRIDPRAFALSFQGSEGWPAACRSWLATSESHTSTLSIFDRVESSETEGRLVFTKSIEPGPDADAGRE